MSLKEKLFLIFQVGAVFIGTIVGAGLASGQEITQFFTAYGYKSFLGIFICFFIYIVMGSIIADISSKYKLSSYDGLIKLVSPGFLGSITNFLTTIFLISGAAIILAGSGSLIHQYFGVSKWFGIIIMCLASLIILFRDTKGLIEINSFIVPSLIIVIITIFILYLNFYKDINVPQLRTIPFYKSNWLFSALIYGGFNILCCSGVIAPLSNEIKSKKVLICGICLGALGLTILSLIINLLLILNVPYIFKYEIPLLYIANRFGNAIQMLLLSIIWLEMFSTEVSNVYSVGKNLEEAFNISYKLVILLIMLIAIPISQIGFVNLISVLYPAFALVGFIFIIQCLFFYFFKKI
ncbi:transporter [Clostridiaceae bacterium UIB06]|uniref:Transporter n=1 Tax=Clostridium thailandense TaxID=2794346 RepID=A0A949TMQ6_9CLOT|nr:transporter [Clostridium thailandense]MBV7273302.1 transporter [Clostridium thailandense]MCH5137327.1 transporter [Clostridiaceae bacterium UIB06]